MGYELVDREIPIDATWKRADLSLALSQILRLGMVQSILIDTTKIKYSQLVEPDADPPSIAVEFDKQNPYSVVRNKSTQEVIVQGKQPLAALALLFQEVALERMHPLLFVTGGNTDLWTWLQSTVDLRRMDVLLGLPVARDRAVDDNTLFLCAGHIQNGSLHDTEKSFKILMEPQ